MNYQIDKNQLKILIDNDNFLQKLFKSNNFQCKFNDDEWVLFNKGYFITYFDGLENICDNSSPSIKTCKQQIPGFRYLLEISNNQISNYLIECNCNQSEKVKSFFEFYDLPSEKLNLTFKNSDFHFRKYRQECIKYINDIINNIKNNQKNSKGIYLHSKNKTGKTFTLMLLANQIAKLQKKVLFISMTTLIYKLQTLKNTTDVNYVNKKDFHKLCLETEFLFIDDIGSGYMNSWIRDNILLHILEHRVKHQMPIFLSSNFSLKELGEWFLCNNANNKFYSKANNANSASQINKIRKLSRKIAELTFQFSWND